MPCRVAPCRVAPLALAALLGGWSLALPAQTVDPTASPECARALASLEAARTAPAQDAREHEVRLDYARRHASRICLGAAPQEPVRPPRMDVPPVRVPPPALVPPEPPRIPQDVPAPAPAAPASQRTPNIVACDAGGCWDSNGARLHRSGAQLIGPQGACIEQAGMLLCQ